MAANTDIIVYNFEALDACSGRLQTVINAVDVTKESLKTLRNSTRSFWEGTAHDGFDTKLGAFNELMEAYLDKLVVTKSKLDTAIAMERQNENTLTGVSNQLTDSSSIFDI